MAFAFFGGEKGCCVALETEMGRREGEPRGTDKSTMSTSASFICVRNGAHGGSGG